MYFCIYHIISIFTKITNLSKFYLLKKNPKSQNLNPQIEKSHHFQLKNPYTLPEIAHEIGTEDCGTIMWSINCHQT